MDVAAQVAVAAGGMEALKDAGLVSGRTNDPAEWMLATRTISRYDRCCVRALFLSRHGCGRGGSERRQRERVAYEYC
jgi:hypothetical protein